MTTTVGQLIVTLFDRYERAYGDHLLAAVATQHRVNTLLRSALGVTGLEPHSARK